MRGEARAFTPADEAPASPAGPAAAAATTVREAPARPLARKGRGATLNDSGRFEPHRREAEDDGWGGLDALPALRTEIIAEKAKTVITRNDSPDISFDRSINPYRGCEHGCVYCFARPTHAFMGLSPGLDFETRLFVKDGAAETLARELAAPGYKPRTIAIGTNTDPYQPIERQHRVMRGVLEVLARARHPVGIVTKSSLILRDLDLLAPMAAQGLVKVAISVTTLDRKLARAMEPRAAAPDSRLETIRRLAEAGVPAGVMVAPIIPGLTDVELETILTRARAAGASEAGYIMLRLPLEVRDLFRDWLMTHRPDRMRHVMGLVKSTRGGKDYDARWGLRMTGEGPYAWIVGRRFEVAAAKLGYARERRKLRCDLFQPPARAARAGAQLSLF
ncbi:MAG: PA0069 family radical SAM protein [Methylobacteriaceae bacterium]|nr:PA0069 family radical SAM protein [Methylobacteriaceae bacterium]